MLILSLLTSCHSERSLDFYDSHKELQRSSPFLLVVVLELELPSLLVGVGVGAYVFWEETGLCMFTGVDVLK